MNRSTTARAAAILAASALLLTGCAAQSDSTGSDTAEASTSADTGPRVAVTYDGGIYVLDGETLEVVADLPVDGFTRVNPIGDGRHVMVTTAEGFQVLDTAAGTDGEPELTDIVFEAEAAGHVVPHAGTTALFDDATGDVILFDTDAFLDAHEMPETEVIESEAAHHGVALQLEDGTVLTTLGDSESRSGVKALDADREETARFEECPGVHGEGTVADEVAVFGCEDGVLVYADGTFTKIDSPDEFGRIGNEFGTESSTVALGDYKNDPDAEGYILSSFSLSDTETGTMQIVDLPGDAGYTFRDLARGAHDEALVLATDGSLHVFDPATGEPIDSFPVIDPWEGPSDWQNPHPALKVDGHVAYVTDPATKTIHAVDHESGEILASVELDSASNEIAVVTG